MPQRDGSTVRSKVRRFEGSKVLVSAAPWLLYLIFACFCLATLLVRARAKPFWHDEIYTVLHSQLPSLQAMWSAGLDGIDLSPPLNTWITRLVHRAAGVGHVATRVVPMAGFLTMTLATFALLRRRTNTPTALAGALLPCFTAAYRYAYEARGYGLMVGLFAIALYAWSEAARGHRRTLHGAFLAIALAASVWNHYYGVLAFVPIVLGESVRAVRRRRIDGAIAAALGASILATLPLLSLAGAARTQAHSFWSPAALGDVGTVYRFLFGSLADRPLLTGAAVLAGIVLLGRRRKGVTALRQVAVHEAVAFASALLIPVFGILLGLVVTGVFVPRYAMPAVVGASILFPLAVWRTNTKGGIAELFLCGFLAVTFGSSMGASVVSPPVFQDPYLSRPLLQRAVTTEAQVVSASSLQFLQYWYYSPTPQKGRLRYLADPEEALRYMGSDTIDRGYLALRRWTAVPIDPFDDYMAGRDELRVHEAGTGWLLRKLADEGAVREQVGAGPGERLYAVRLRKGNLSSR